MCSHVFDRDLKPPSLPALLRCRVGGRAFGFGRDLEGGTARSAAGLRARRRWGPEALGLGRGGGARGSGCGCPAGKGTLGERRQRAAELRAERLVPAPVAELGRPGPPVTG